MYSTADFQLHRLLKKAIVQQLINYTMTLFPEAMLEIRDISDNPFLESPPSVTTAILLAQSPILVDSKQIGTVTVKTFPQHLSSFSPAAISLAKFWGLLLSSIAQLQWERRSVAQDSINRYRELAFLHQLGEKMASSLDSEKLADIILSEVQKITKAIAGSLMLNYRTSGNLTMIANFGSHRIASCPGVATPTRKLAEIVFRSGKAEVINAAGTDPRLADVVACSEPLLCVPLKIDNRVLGVLNLIGSEAFSSEDLKLTEVIACHAANAFETSRLFRELENMAYAIILSASATIDERDDCTAGHSTRVADISLAIAKILNQQYNSANPPRPMIKLREIEYAALLHDIGKIGVPEAILTKRSRLTADRLLAIKTRFEFITATTGQDLSQETKLLTSINEAHSLSPEQCREVKALTERRYTDLKGNTLPFIWSEEEEALCVARGNLVAKEFKQIQSHAEKSYRILRKIPFPAELGRIPHIAYQHHERLNGRGYPNGLTSNEILLEAKILSVADVFEALTANDRPYRSPVSTADALEILRKEAADGYLDNQSVDALAHILHSDTTWFASLTIGGKNKDE